MKPSRVSPTPPHDARSKCARKGQGGQAMVELAIVGSLAMLALAVLIQIGLRMNYQQQIEQQTFRMALQKAHDEDTKESASVTYVQIRDRKVPDPSQGFPINSRVRSEASSTVTWGEHLTLLDKDRDSQPRVIIALNQGPTGPRRGTIQEYRSEDILDEPGPPGNKDKKPLFKNIRRDIRSTGHMHQTNDTNSLSTTTTEDSTVTLNTKKNNVLTSTLGSKSDYNW